MTTQSGPFSIGSDTWPGIAKLIEETGEVSQVAGKLIQVGGSTEHWDGGGDLKVRLEQELADLQAAIDFVTTENGLDQTAIAARSADKLALFRRWHREQSGLGDRGHQAFEPVGLDDRETESHRSIVPLVTTYAVWLIVVCVTSLAGSKSSVGWLLAAVADLAATGLLARAIRNHRAAASRPATSHRSR